MKVRTHLGSVSLHQRPRDLDEWPCANGHGDDSSATMLPARFALRRARPARVGVHAHIATRYARGARARTLGSG
eukprot:scaffold62556_cov69-Phaeocystis_antarctica.AAC.8